jgi:hypothetical protein
MGQNSKAMNKLSIVIEPRIRPSWAYSVVGNLYNIHGWLPMDISDQNGPSGFLFCLFASLLSVWSFLFGLMVSFSCFPLFAAMCIFLAPQRIYQRVLIIYPDILYLQLLNGKGSLTIVIFTILIMQFFNKYKKKN